jgi:hypothetical protein
VRKIEAIMQKEMTRREFLIMMGLGVVSLFGLSSILGLFSKSSSSIETVSRPGYGLYDYGP